MQDLREIGPTLLLRAAAHVREAADPHDDPHGGCELRSSASCSTISSAWRGAMARRFSTASRCRCRAGCSMARQCPGLCAAEERARPLARARRLHRRRGDRAGPVLVLSLARPEPEAALRPDRSLPLCHRAAGRRRSTPTPSARPRPNVDIRIAENGEVLFKSPGMFVGYFKDDGQDRGGDDAGRLREDRRCRLLRREDRPSEDHRPRQGCRQAQRRHAVPAEIHREQAQVLSRTSARRWPTATSATSSP